MKRILLIFALLSVISAFSSCEKILSFDGIETNSNTNTSQDVSAEESRTPPEEIYSFLNSPYTVTAKRDNYGKIYVQQYYIIDGKVAGTKLMTSFSEVESAVEYFELIEDKFPNSELKGATVINYVEKDQKFYYGYTVEKLKFFLEKANYTVTLNFSEDIFNEASDTSIEE